MTAYACKPVRLKRMLGKLSCVTPISTVILPATLSLFDGFVPFVKFSAGSGEPHRGPQDRPGMAGLRTCPPPRSALRPPPARAPAPAAGRAGDLGHLGARPPPARPAVPVTPCGSAG
ncbi:hypothetical protein OV450_4705 [Actinobacteria bacterium OV450]|nr:hypothetical protein OV450_4705 [Actinobacteria bacterium OV450]